MFVQGQRQPKLNARGLQSLKTGKKLQLISFENRLQQRRCAYQLQTLKAEKLKVQTTFPEVITQQGRLNSQKQSFIHVIRDQNVASKAAVAYLGARKEVANCGLHFRGFKRKNTLRSLNITLKNSKKSYKEDIQTLASKKLVRVTHFEYKIQQTMDV